MSYFIGKSHFEEDGTQNYLVLQPIQRYFKLVANIQYISSWKSKGLSDESIKPPSTSDNSLFLLIDCLGNKVKIKFNGSCLKQPKLSNQYSHKTIVNIYMVLLVLLLMIQYKKTLCLARLNWLKSQILISTSIRVMALDLIENQVLHFQSVDLAKI